MQGQHDPAQNLLKLVRIHECVALHTLMMKFFSCTHMKEACILHTKYSTHEVQYTRSTLHTKYSTHEVQHTRSTAHTKYSTHEVQYTRSTLHTKYSTHEVQHTRSTSHTKYSTHEVHHTRSTSHTKYSTHEVQYTQSTSHTKYTRGTSSHCSRQGSSSHVLQHPSPALDGHPIPIIITNLVAAERENYSEFFNKSSGIHIPDVGYPNNLSRAQHGKLLQQHAADHLV